jgi:hypothetical protein
LNTASSAGPAPPLRQPPVRRHERGTAANLEAACGMTRPSNREEVGVMTSGQLEDLMKSSNVRMAGLGRQAQITAGLLETTETVIDVVKAYRVLVDGKKVGRGSGFALVFLSNLRLIIACGDDTSIRLSDIAAVTELIKGEFTWRATDTKTWSFEHARGIIRANGNQANTVRFHAALVEQLGSIR